MLTIPTGKTFYTKSFFWVKLLKKLGMKNPDVTEKPRLSLQFFKEISAAEVYAKANRIKYELMGTDV